MNINEILERLEEAIKECKQLQHNTDDVYGYMKMKQGLVCAKEIVREVAEKYNEGWILCTDVDHPDDAYDCEVTILQNGEYIRDIGFYTDRWRRLSDETPILVVAWKEPSVPYQPK